MRDEFQIREDIIKQQIKQEIQEQMEEEKRKVANQFYYLQHEKEALENKLKANHKAKASAN
jgi:hypothetical protein